MARASACSDKGPAVTEERDPEVLKSECTLALARYQQSDPTASDLFELACSMFFAGVDAMVAEPRTLAAVEAELLIVRQTAPVRGSRPRKKPNYGGQHAQHGSRTDIPAPARRASDPLDAAIAAEIDAEARRARERERDCRRARWADADNHSPEVTHGIPD